MKLKKLITVSAATLMLASAGVGLGSTRVSANYMSYNERQARYSRRVYVRKPIRLQKMSGNVFAYMHITGYKWLHKGESIGVAPFYHMGKDGYVVYIPGHRGVYYARTNSHSWYGNKTQKKHIYSKYDKESIRDGRRDLRNIGKSSHRSNQYLIKMEDELSMTDEAAGVPAKRAKEAVNWIVRHGDTLLLKKDEYWNSFDHNRSIMRIINKSIHGKHARKQARKGEHAKAQFNSNFYVYNPKKFGKKGYDMMYSTGFDTKHGYKSHFQRSNNPTLLKKSGFKDLREDGANFIFNKYAPNNSKAVVPKNINFTYTGWYQGRFGQNHPKVFADYGHNTWYLHN